MLVLRCSVHTLFDVNIFYYLQELEPYLPELFPYLKQTLIDPAPEVIKLSLNFAMYFIVNQVRSYAAKALGTMATGIEDDGLKELLSWLLSTLKSNSGSVDRAGAAQGKYCSFR